MLVAITFGLILFLIRNKEIPKTPISNFNTTENAIINWGVCLVLSNKIYFLYFLFKTDLIHLIYRNLNKK